MPSGPGRDGRPRGRGLHALPPAARRGDDVLGAPLAGASQPRAGGAHIVLADLYQSGQHYVEADGDAVLASYPEVERLGEVRGRGRRSPPWSRRSGAATAGAACTGPRRPLARRAALRRPGTWSTSPRTTVPRARRPASSGAAAWAFPIDGRTLPLVTSRGCPFRCGHCSSNPGREPGVPKTQRRLSAERLREHVHGPRPARTARRGCEVLDELINVSERHFDALPRHVDVPPDVALRRPQRHARRLPRAASTSRRMRGRVTTLSVSAESGSQRVVDRGGRQAARPRDDRAGGGERARRGRAAR